MAKCAFCDASFETGPGDILLVCPYCGTAQTATGVKFKDHYMIRVHFSASDAQKTLLDWCSKQLGAPQDLSTSAKFVKSELIFYPFWISRVDASSQYQGFGRDATFHDEWPQRRGAYKRISFFEKPESGSFVRRHEISIPGFPEIDPDIKNFPIPTRAKEFFSHAHAEEHNGKVLHSKIGEDEAKATAKKIAFDNQTALIMSEVVKVSSRSDKIDVGETFLIHVPIWEMEYRYGNGKYKASVSAATGYVIESKYPRSKSFRAMGIGFGCLSALVGIGLLFLAYQLEVLVGGGYVAGSLLLIIGLAFLYKGLSRKEAKEKI
ncbi:MAG: hypothetical protein HXY34_05360 [Candidatus Thorarchaeota archaeon]|nr:hypothetical protein [Candidatus Thorarchaeota archaeon]